jgi:hypothetical protein
MKNIIDTTLAAVLVIVAIPLVFVHGGVVAVKKWSRIGWGIVTR